MVPPDILERSWVYTRTVLATRYVADGFVRRGLAGTIAWILSDDWHLRAPRARSIPPDLDADPKAVR